MAEEIRDASQDPSGIAVRGLEALDDLSQVFASLGSAPRLRILYLLHHRPDLSVGELSYLVGISISGVSTHLQRLKRSGLVNCRKDGQTVCCTLQGTSRHVRFLKGLFEEIATETGGDPLRERGGV